MSQEEWRPLSHTRICDGYYLSTYGRIRFKDDEPYEPEYHSTNGYDYSSFILKKEYMTTSPSQLFPIDTLIGLTFLTYDPDKRNMEVRINHIDGNTRNNHLSNLEWVEDVEEWRPLIASVKTKSGEIARVRSSDYMISSRGRVYSIRTKIIMKSHVESDYCKINMPYYINDTVHVERPMRIHRAMAWSFDIPGHDEKHNVINHIDGNTLNNSLKNLEWVTQQENTQHAFLVGLEVNPKGQEHPRAKFTDHQRKCIYEILKTLKWTPPKLLMMLIAERLPNISHDDVKYAKQVIRKTEGFEFPILPKYGPGSIAQISDEEITDIRKIVNSIFDKYGITGVEVYENKYKKNN